MQKKLERRRRRRDGEGREEMDGLKEQMPPSEPVSMDKTPSPIDSPHPSGDKYSPGKKSPHTHHSAGEVGNREVRTSKFILPQSIKQGCVSQPVSCIKISTTLSLNTAKIKTTPTLSLGHRDDSQINQYIHLQSKCRHIRCHVASFNNCMG